MNSLRIVMAQLNLLVGDIEGNARKIIQTCQRARQQHQAEVVLFPELALVGYPPEDILLRPDLYTRCEKALAEIQAQVDDVYVLLGLPLREGKAIYNAVAVLHRQQRINTYYKHELPNYSVFDEKRYFTAGHAPCVLTIKGMRLGLTVCEDIWAGEAVDKAVAAGAQAILNLNASPYHLHKDAERHRVVRQHVQRHGIPILYLNLFGGQDELVFDGASFVMAADGQCTHQWPAFCESLAFVELHSDGKALRPLPGEQAPALSEEESVFRALVTGVRDYVHKNRLRGAVIGLSGGIDSALTLAIAVEALGAEAIEVVMMPSRYTAQMSLDDAEQQCAMLAVPHRTISIEPPFQAFLSVLEEEFRGLPIDTTEENMQARCRGLILMAIANKKRYIALTTGNKSEMAVGYSTLYGDMAGGFDVLKDVSKTLVYRLANWCNREREIIPRRVIERPPSAELAPDQKDSDTLPEYALLDPILARYVEQDQGLDEIVSAGFDAATVQRVIRMVDSAEHKRRQAPPGVRITPRAFGRDRRYPLTSGYHRYEKD